MGKRSSKEILDDLRRQIRETGSGLVKLENRERAEKLYEWLQGKLPKDFRGVVVRQLNGNGTAAKAGLKEWDIVVSINGKTYERTEKLLRFIRSKKPGDTLQLKATDRQGKNLRELSVKLVPIN